MIDKKLEIFIKKLEKQGYTKYYTRDILNIDNEDYIICPLHPDSSKNCYVNIDQEYFECSSCGVNGGLISLLVFVEKKSFKTIVLHLAKETQTEIPPIILGMKPSNY